MKNNPFEQMQSFMNCDLSKSMQDMPFMDINEFTNMVRSNSETISNTMQATSEAMQNIFKRATDSMQRNTSEICDTMKDAVSSGDTGQIASCQKKYIRNTIDSNVGNFKEAMEVSTKSTNEILDMMKNTIDDNVNKACAATKSQSKK